VHVKTKQEISVGQPALYGDSQLITT